MAIAYLSKDDKVGVHNPGTVYGSSGTEKVLIQSGATNVTISPTVEEVHFSLNSSQYAFSSAAGGAVAIYRGGTLLATLTVTPGKQELRFADGAVKPGVDANSGAIMLGSMTLDPTPRAYSGSVDASHRSENAPTTAAGIDDASVLSAPADDAVFDVQLAGVDDAALLPVGDFGA